MAPVPTRESLESLKRADLQKLCKDYGVKANLKTEALIDLVLDATKRSENPPPSHPQRSSSTRIVSTRSSGHSRLRSGGSLIVHDTDEEDEENAVEEKPPEPKPDPPPSKRTTRKAKETQFRLGVGRPKVVGGTGPRAVTKSIGVLKGKHISKSTKVTEETITEEQEPEPTNDGNQTPTDPDPSGVEHDHAPTPPVETQLDSSETQQTHEEPVPLSVPSLDKINNYINELVRPLQEQIQSFRLEFERLNHQIAELLEAKVHLTNEVEMWRGQAGRVEDQVVKLRERFEMAPSANQISPEGSNNFSREQSSSTPNDENKPEGSHPYTQVGSQELRYSHSEPTTLGKRHREVSSSDLTDVIEAGTQEGFSEKELAQKVIRPQKKRPKISKDEKVSATNVAGPSRLESSEESSGPAFTVFSGPEERSDYVDPPPPTTHLSDLFGHQSPVTPSNDIRTDSAQAAENHNPFGLSFSRYQAITSTPVYATNGLASYLERPESPTSHVIERTGRQDRASPFFVHRHDAEQPERHERSSSPQNNSHAPMHDQSTDPLSDLLKTPPLEAVREGIGADTQQTAINRGPGIGLPDIRMDDTPAPPIKRTMYGTELEADTRFGDFGVEGIATGYWQGVQRRY